MGMKGGWVVELQRLLKQLGYSVTVDGDWRQKTTDAVVKLQQTRGLTPDGWVGPNTWQALLD